MTTAGSRGDGDGSGVDDWMRSGLNAQPGLQPPVADAGSGHPRPGGWFTRRTAFLGAGLAAAGIVGASVVISTILEKANPADGGTLTTTATTASSESSYTTSSAPTASPSAGLDNLDVLADLVAADPELARLVAACGAGDRGACGAVLDLLAQDCADGYLASCDGLFWVAPVGSDFAVYGATCGGRVGPESAGRCAEQGG